MDQKLTEEQQRSAHKVIKANRGDCLKESKFFSCINCPNSAYNSGVLCFTSDFPERSKSPAFQAENLRRSQAWLDAHITDAEIMAESPREFCERMVRTEGEGKCIPGCEKLCLKCVLNLCETGCSGSIFRFRRAKAYLASHSATPQEPPKRRPTPDEMVVGATVRVRLWDELVRDGKLDSDGDILFQKSASFFDKEMRKFCGTTHKITKSEILLILDGCGDWTFIPEMLDYVEPEKVVEPKTAAVNFFDWCGKKVVFKDGRNKGAQYTVCEVQRDIDHNYCFILRLIELKGLRYSARLFNLCETKDVAKPEPVANAPTPDTLRIIALEGQVDDLTKKLAASKKLCDRQQRRLRANWEAKRDEEMCTHGELDLWLEKKRGCAKVTTLWNMPNKYDSVPKDWEIRPNGHTDWIPATRGNLKL